MKTLVYAGLLAGAAALGGCATVAPTGAAAQCGTYGYVDVNNDGFISGDEWNTYRSNGYGFWDTNKDGRISRSEFQNCWYGGGFFRDTYYNRDYWNHYWSAFDTNGDGYLSSDEYWSADAWNRLDRNHNGRIDADEYVWWNG